MMELQIREMTPQERHYCYSQSAQIEAWRDELTVEYTDAYNALIGK